MIAIIVGFIFIAAGLSSVKNCYDIAVTMILGIFIFLGHRWAMIGVMLFWTVEKGYMIYTSFNSASAGYDFWMQLLWWTFFMHCFWAAYKVEDERRKITTKRVVEQSSS